jgi:hypothetical protein
MLGLSSIPKFECAQSGVFLPLTTRLHTTRVKILQLFVKVLTVVRQVRFASFSDMCGFTELPDELYRKIANQAIGSGGDHDGVFTVMTMCLVSKSYRDLSRPILNEWVRSTDLNTQTFQMIKALYSIRALLLIPNIRGAQ